jgi:hypothetical protein
MPTYSDGEMRAIMGRALQIDSGRSERFTPEQLRAIAGELGISTQALEVAMYEADSKGVPVQSPFASTQPRRWTKTLAIGFAVFLIVAAGAMAFMRVAPRNHIDRVEGAPGGDVARVAPAPVRATPVAPSAEPTPTPARTKITTKKKF